MQFTNLGQFWWIVSVEFFKKEMLKWLVLAFPKRNISTSCVKKIFHFGILLNFIEKQKWKKCKILKTKLFSFWPKVFSFFVLVKKSNTFFGSTWTNFFPIDFSSLLSSASLATKMNTWLYAQLYLEFLPKLNSDTEENCSRFPLWQDSTFFFPVGSWSLQLLFYLWKLICPLHVEEHWAFLSLGFMMPKATFLGDGAGGHVLGGEVLNLILITSVQSCILYNACHQSLLGKDGIHLTKGRASSPTNLPT